MLDHLVVGAATLEEGIAYIRDVLGVEVPAGGKHPRMGTYNRLMRLGDSVFLEIIAVDPDAPPPGYPRWFALDDPDQQTRLRERPRLIAWVAGARDIASVLEDSPADLGRTMEMARGDLAWLIGVREDGALPEGGTLPVLILWPEGPHPASRMPDLGVRLERLRLRHPEPESLAASLEQLGVRHLVDIADTDGEAGPRIEADFRRPDGKRITIL